LAAQRLEVTVRLQMAQAQRLGLVRL